MNAGQTARALTRLQQGTYDSRGERLDWTYWSEASLLSTTLTHRLFTAGLGGGTGLRLDQTNLNQGGQMPQGQNLRVYNIISMITGPATALTNAALQNYYDMLRQSTIQFQIPGKDAVGEWTLQQLVGSNVNIIHVPTVAGDNVPFSAVGRYVGIMPLNQYIELAALTPFELLLTHHAAPNATLDGMIVKEGINGRLKRAS